MKLASLLLLALALHARAQYQLTSWTTDAGGGSSTGGVYTVAATIGQPDANTHTGGPYTLTGGFWSSVAVVPTPGAPLLRIIHANTRVILAWPDPSTGFQLQASPSLSAPVWVDVPDAPSIVGAEKQVVQPLNPGMRFFRLRKP